MSDTTIRVHITNQHGELLNSCEYDLVKLERAIAKSRRQGASQTLMARDMACIGDAVAEMVTDEVLAALARRRKAKQASARAESRAAKAKKGRAA